MKTISFEFRYSSTAIVLALAACMLLALGSQAKSENGFLCRESHSLIRVIAMPQAMHGQTVEIVGYLDFERSALLVSREDSEHGLTKNGVWLDANEQVAAVRDSGENYHYCNVTGVLDMDNLGPGQAYSGTLHQVTEIDCFDINAEFEKWGIEP